MLPRWLAGTEERARDIQRTLSYKVNELQAAALREDFAPVLLQFQKLSQQLDLSQRYLSHHNNPLT